MILTAKIKTKLDRGGGVHRIRGNAERTHCLGLSGLQAPLWPRGESPEVSRGRQQRPLWHRRSRCVSARNFHTATATMGKLFSRPLLPPSHRKSNGRSPQGSNPPNPNPTMTLPPEILSKILDNVPADREGRRTLVACALVATWWTRPSQRRLFSSVEIDEDNYKRWMKGVVLSRAKAQLLEHVHSLRHSRGLGYRMRKLPRDSGKYLSALHNLHTLALYDTRVERISEAKFRTCFSAFRETLTHLTLETFTTSFSAFVTLVDYFPNITTLRLHLFALDLDRGPVPSLSRPLRGKLHVREVQVNCLEFLDRFAKLDQGYEELVIDTSLLLFMGTRFVASALQISTSTVKFLRLTAELQCEQPLPAPTETISLPRASSF